jgi:hypothetical protein
LSIRTRNAAFWDYLLFSDTCAFNLDGSATLPMTLLLEQMPSTRRSELDSSTL